MQDIYFMNKFTGELKPSGEAIRDFYKEHGALEAWTDEWEETNYKVEGQYIGAPDFVGALNF